MTTSIKNLNVSLRIKIFIVSVLIIVVGQYYYSYNNVESFQSGYLNTIQEKSEKLGRFLKDDVEFVLNLKIPLTKLIKLEKTLNQILKAAPELERIEITDLEGYVLYYADHASLGRVPEKTRKAAIFDEEATKRIKNLGLSKKDTDIQIPVYYLRDNQHVGYINMRISPELIVGKSREILFDMLTVILTSLLITFEFLTFFVAYSISDPIKEITYAVQNQLKSERKKALEKTFYGREMAEIVDRFNYFSASFQAFISPYRALSEYIRIRNTAEKAATVSYEIEKIKSKVDEDSTLRTKPEYRAVLERILNQTRVLSIKMSTLKEVISGTSTKLDEAKIRISIDKSMAYAYIRPLIFVFVMADGFCLSFFPMFVDKHIQSASITWLSEDVIRSLPISFYMLFLAISMPLSGSITDRFGWLKPLLGGVLLNAFGLLMTALSGNFLQLIIYRSLTAAGFGIVFISVQKFVIEKTSKENRALGLAEFAAAFFSGDICGTVIGGMLANRIGYENVFIVSAVVSLMTFALSLVIFKNKIDSSNTTKKGDPFPFRYIFKVFTDIDFFAVVFLQAIPAKIIFIGFLYYLLPLYLRSIGTLQSNIGRIFILYGIAIIFLGPFFSKFFDFANLRKYFIFIGGVITGLSMLIFHMYHGFFAAMFIVLMIGVAHTFSVSSQGSFISETRIVKKIGQGTGMGLFRFWERLGNVTGPILVGSLITFSGYEKTIIYIGFLSLITSALYLTIILLQSRKTKKRV